MHRLVKSPPNATSSGAMVRVDILPGDHLGIAERPACEASFVRIPPTMNSSSARYMLR